MNFDPMQDVPTNDEEVEIALKYENDELIGRNLYGIYRCRRGLGDSLLTAYEKALMAVIEKSKIT